MTGGILNSYQESWEQQQEGPFIPETAGAATGGVHYTGDGVITLHYWNNYDGTIAIK